MNLRHSPRSLSLALPLALPLVTLAPACGDDGGGGSSGTGTESSTGTSDGSTGGSTTSTSGGTSTSGSGTTSATTTDGTDSGSSTGSSSTGSTGGDTDTGGNVPPCPYTEVPGMPDVAVEEIADGFTRPVLALGHPEVPDRLFVVEQVGTIRILEPGQNAAPNDTFLDISSAVDTGPNEAGLLGFAFHPDFPTDPRVYVNYNPTQGSFRTRVSEFTLDANDPDLADVGSERVILELDQPAGNHNGGMIAFGPDGNLYIGMGDGGASCDNAADASRDNDALLAKILRIGVEPDGTDDNPSACDSCATYGPFDYTIPADNPFVGTAGVADEIFAAGVRNPWRFAFDGSILYVGDVGQDSWEEIDVVESGKDYGWVEMEGNHCSQSLPASGCGGSACDDSAAPGMANSDGMVAPIAEYSHQATNGCSITGGSVYRSCEVPSWDGIYFYSDYCDGQVRALRWDGSSVTDLGVVADLFSNATGNGWNAWGDVYFVTQQGFSGAGSVYRIVPQ